jgi:hypothetical protein
MRMITASFARVIERCTGHLCMQFLLIFQQVGAISKTCNQIIYHPQSGWFEDTPLKGGAEEGCPLKGVPEDTCLLEARQRVRNHS